MDLKHSLLIFFTQYSEPAPGSSPRQGENFVHQISDQLCDFLESSLGISLTENFDQRALDLKAPKWKAFQKETYDNQFSKAFEESLKFFPKMIFMCGNHALTLKTAQILGGQMALPICVHASLDRSSSDKPALGNLTEFLPSFLNELSEIPPLLLVGTSHGALTEWLQSLGQLSLYEKELSAELPMHTFICVYHKGAENPWLFDKESE